MSCVSSIHSNVLRALRVRMPTKLKQTVDPAQPQTPIETVIDFAPPMTLPQTSIVIAEPPARSKRKAATKASTAIQPSHKRSSPSITELDESMASTHNCPPNLLGKTAHSTTEKSSDVKTTTNSIQIYCIHNQKTCCPQSRRRTIKLYRRPLLTHSEVPDTVLSLPEFWRTRKYHDSPRGGMRFWYWIRLNMKQLKK